MKMTKRAICLLLAVVMALALTVPVLAMDEPDVPEAALADTPDVPAEAAAGSITLHAGDQGAFSDGNDEYKVTATEELKLKDLPKPERTGWTFNGWYTEEITYHVQDKNASASDYWTWIPDKEGLQPITDDQFAAGVTELYAGYTPTVVKFHMYTNGWMNLFGGMECSRQYGVPFHDTVYNWNDKPDSWPGFTFNGWYTADGVRIQTGDPVTGKDVYMHWYKDSDPSINQDSASRDYEVGTEAKYFYFQDSDKTRKVHAGGSFDLEVMTGPERASLRGITWSTSDESVAYIESWARSGKVARVRAAAGDNDQVRTATITAELPNGLKAEMTVIVGHDYSKVIYTYAATCTHKGEQQRECTVPGCPQSRKNYVLEILPHSFTKSVTVPATCTTDGYVEKTCSVCGYVEKSSNGMPASHNIVTSTEDGCGGKITVEKCTVCGYTKTTGGDGSAHTWEAGPRIDVEATCIHDGSKSIHCSNCGATKEVTPIPATNKHDFTAWKVIDSPSWEHEGLQTRTCNNCTLTEEQVIPKRSNIPGGGGGGSATPSPSPSTSPEPSESPSPEPSPEPGTTPAPVPVPVEPPKTDNGSGWSYDYDTGDYYYFVDGTPKANYWAKEETASQWGYWYYVGTDGKLATGLQYIENNNGTGWYFLQPDTANGCVGRMLTGWQWIGPEAGTGWFNTAHGGLNGQCTYTTEWGDYNAADNTWGKDHIAH